MPRTGHNRIPRKYHNATAGFNLDICKHYDIKAKYSEDVSNVRENQEATILLDMPIQTEKERKKS